MASIMSSQIRTSVVSYWRACVFLCLYVNIVRLWLQRGLPHLGFPSIHTVFAGLMLMLAEYRARYLMTEYFVYDCRRRVRCNILDLP